MLHYDSWHCPHCRGCLKTSGYIRITRNPEGSVRLRLIWNEFWRTAPSGADEGQILQAVIESSRNDQHQDEGTFSTLHRFRFWDNVMVRRTNDPSGEPESGCVMEIGETRLRVLLYETMENEWFSHEQLTLDPGTETYWASQAIHEIANFDTPGGATNYGNAGSSGDTLPPETQQVHLDDGYAQFPREPPWQHCQGLHRPGELRIQVPQFPSHRHRK